ncbi:MAG TPA: OmpA family protein [Opitutaceae bacterium]|nr:OmpA family protein [Opitutaceae bacterium]
MKSVSHLATFAVAGSLLLLAGCAKKPVRPDPSATLIGPGGASGASSLNPQDVGNADNNGLQARDQFDASGQLRGVLEPVYFKFNQSAIDASERAKLQAAKDYLDKNPQYHLLVEGHCDWRGTPEYNLGLGDRRANEAKKYLVSLGVSADKLETLSKGSEEAKKDGTAADWAKDRRDDLVVLKGNGP